MLINREPYAKKKYDNNAQTPRSLFHHWRKNQLCAELLTPHVHRVRGVRSIRAERHFDPERTSRPFLQL